MADLTVITLTYNEEVNLADCLMSVKDIAKRIVVCDSFSIDKTVDIANMQVSTFMLKKLRILTLSGYLGLMLMSDLLRKQEKKSLELSMRTKIPM